MKVVFYFPVLCQLMKLAATITSTRGNCKESSTYEDPPFVRNLCKLSPDLGEFMIAADIMIRSDCDLVDACRRVVDQPQKDNEEVDFIVVGGGAAGPVVASRLSENPSWTVALLEAGPEQPAATDIPALVSAGVATKYDWKYITVPQKNACLAYQGVCGWPRGKMLGGTVALSGSMYSRGDREIYDTWSRNGNPGWGYDNVLPIFKLIESNMNYNSGTELEIHGIHGPLPVRKPTDILPITRTLIEMGRELGYPIIDMSEPRPMGFSIAQTTFTATNTRVTVAGAYLRPYLRSRNNLRVIINSYVTRLLVNAEDKSVYGVEYMDVTRNVTRRMVARKEVILSAGVIGSAQILMVSGIGPAETLGPLGVPVIQNLRVGYNLQHHVASKLTIRTNVTQDNLLSFESVAQYLSKRTGPMSTTGALQTSAFLRSDQVGPNEPSDLQLFFDGFVPNCKYSWPVYGRGCQGQGNVLRLAELNVRPVNIRPLSRGTIKLVSRDPFVRPVIDPAYLSVDKDIAVLLWGLKLATRMVNTTAMQRLGAVLDSTPVEHCREYEFATDAYWTCLIRYYTKGENHHAGTCKMGPASDPNAVVDPQLRVHNVKGVRVADASIMPLQPNSNPIASIVMIGEKAARFIKNTWN